jgi:STE24 endopeptidase
LNESKASRYHRTRRRAGAAQALAVVVVLAGLIFSGVSLRLRDLVGGSVAGYVFLLTVIYESVTFPFVWYRGCWMERQYELSRMTWWGWLRDYLKTASLTVVLAVAAAAFVYTSMARWPAWWWLIAAAAGTALAAAMTWLAPIWLLPLFHAIRPLNRGTLSRRLRELSARAGVDVLGVHEWTLGATTTRASAALAGAGPTRRILVSDTLLADYTDDEIEVVLAHEMGHHVHHDVLKTLIAEFAVLAGGFWAGGAALGRWSALAGREARDVAGLPVLLLAAGGVSLLVRPLLNALSRANERRADRFALELTRQPAAFMSAVRRMAAQNLAEEHPSRAAFVMFHTHPTVEERIAAARGIADPSSLVQR